VSQLQNASRQPVSHDIDIMGQKSITKVKSQSSIFSKFGQKRFENGMVPGQNKDMEILHSPAPNQYTQNSL
jgi:hypothetical protein